MNLSEPLRTALVNDAFIVARLGTYQGGRPVFTRRPVPDDAPMPMIIVSPDIVTTDEDGINDDRPVVTRDVSVYGKNDTADKYRVVEDLGWLVRDLFHRQRAAITVPGWTVMDIRCTGPRVAPVDEVQTVGRVVELTVRLARR